MKRSILILITFLLLVSTAFATSISGNITNTFKKPIEGATVSLAYADTGKIVTQDKTDMQGTYFFEYEGSNDIYLLTAEASEYHGLSKKVFLNSSKNHVFDIELQQIIKGSMSFSISDEKEVPLEGAITLFDEQKKSVATITFTLGKATFTNIPLGKYMLLVEATGFKEYAQEVEMSLADMNKKYIIQLISTPQVTTKTEEKKEAEVSALYYDYIRPQFSKGKATFEWELYRLMLISFEGIDYKIRLSKVEAEKQQTILIMPGKILVNTTLGKKTFFDLNNDKENDMSITVNRVYKKAFPSGFIDTYINVTLSILKEEAKAMNKTTNETKIAVTQNKTTPAPTINQTINQTINKKSEQEEKLAKPAVEEEAIAEKEGKAIIFITGKTTTGSDIKKEGIAIAVGIILIGLLIYLIIVTRKA